MLLVLFVFVGLLIAGRIKDESSWSSVLVCSLIALGALAAFIELGWQPNFYIAALGMIDVVLVLVVFKGDVQIR